MKKILQVSSFIIIIYSSCCSNDKENNPNENNPVVYNDKYYLVIDKNYKLYKVTVSSEYRGNFTIEYNYLKDSIVATKLTNSSVQVTTYYLNNHDLADSCKSSISTYVSKTFFYYDSIGYLNSRIEKGMFVDTTNYVYRNGNLVNLTYHPKKPPGIYSVSYQYNASKNLINLESFTGAWLGVLNNNLMQQKAEQTIAGGVVYVYNYTINSSGLVEKMTTIQKDYIVGKNELTIIGLFEYKII